MHALRQFMAFIRRECGVRDGYRHLEAYLKDAPLDVMRDVELLTMKLNELEMKAKRKGELKVLRSF